MKKLLLLIMAFVVAISCVACGPTANNDKIEIVIGYDGGDSGEEELLMTWREAFIEENPEVKIKLKAFTGSNYNNTMMNYNSAPNSMPDIIWTTGEEHATWATNGMFINLKSRLEADEDIDLDDFYPSMINCTHKYDSDEGIYFVPRDYNKPVLIINKVVFRYAGFSEEEITGLKDGWNYGKFLNVCERLRTAMDAVTDTGSEEWKHGVRFKNYPLDAQMTWNASYMSFIKSFGGKLVEDNGTINFVSDANIAAYGQIYELMANKYIPSSNTQGTADFSRLGSAMVIKSRPSLASLSQSDTEKYDLDFLPLPLDYVGVGCSGYAISRKAKDRVGTSTLNVDNLSNEDYAYKFIKFIVSEEGQKIGAATGSIVPVLQSLKNDESWINYHYGTVREGANHAAFVYSSSAESDFSNAAYRAFDPRDALVIFNNMQEVMTQVVNIDNYVEYIAGSDDPVFIEGYTKLKSALSGLQNNVKNYQTKY